MARKQTEQNIVVKGEGVKCPHCGNRFNSFVKNTYPNGRRRRLCGCGHSFVEERPTVPVT